MRQTKKPSASFLQSWAFSPLIWREIPPEGSQSFRNADHRRKRPWRSAAQHPRECDERSQGKKGNRAGFSISPHPAILLHALFRQTGSSWKDVSRPLRASAIKVMNMTTRKSSRKSSTIVWHSLNWWVSRTMPNTKIFTMAKNPSNVYKLLDELLKAYKPVAINEYNEVKGFATGLENKDMTIMPWDWNFYSEKLKDSVSRQRRDDVPTSNWTMHWEHFRLATQLYGITFKKSKRIPVYNKEVETYEVFDADGSFSAFFTRISSRVPRNSRALGWTTSKHNTWKTEKDSRPDSPVMNFTRPTGDKPVLYVWRSEHLHPWVRTFSSRNAQ